MDGLRDVARRTPLRAAVQWRRHRGLTAADAYVASYPRSGNTWLRFMLVQLATGEPADFVSVDRLSPPVGTQRGAPPLLPGGGRLVKTHEPWRADYARGVYLVRDPREVVVSWYSVLRADPGRLDDLGDFVRAFARGRIAGYGSWRDHVEGWVAAARRAPIRVERFEELRGDPHAFVARAARHLGIGADPSAVEAAVATNSAEGMRALERANLDYLTGLGRRSQGVRAGAAPPWRDVLTDRQLAELRPDLELARQFGYAP